MKAMKRCLGMKAQIEMAKRSEKQNIDYCKKEGDWFEIGKTMEERIAESRFNTLHHIIRNDKKKNRKICVKKRR